MVSSNRELGDYCRKKVALDAVGNVSCAFSVDNFWRMAFHLASYVQEYLGNAMLVFDDEHWLAVKVGSS